MKLTIKDLISVAVVTVVSLPILYLAALFMFGYARLEIGPSKLDPEQRRQTEILRQTKRRDSLAVAQSEAFKAKLRAEEELERERERLNRREQQIDMMRNELEEQRNELRRERERLEKLIDQSEELRGKRLKQLARVYGAMRPAEAAQILETLDDDLVIKILNNIRDDRQKGKIMGALSKAKASRISAKMGKRSNG
jgi:flagellar motility protein MotE (MotC chaperone)